MTNDNTYLLIGPSGIGKSSAISHLDKKDLLIFKLDNVIRDSKNISSISDYLGQIGKEQFFKDSIDSINKLAQQNAGKKILVDVGAGSIDWEGCNDIYLNFKIISLTCNKKVLYKRIQSRGKEKRTYEQYIASEFKPHKQTLYEHAKFQIDTTNMDSKGVADEIEKALNVTLFNFNFKYKPTPLNIVSGLLLLWLLKDLGSSLGEVQMAFAITLPAIIVLLAIDFLAQAKIKNYLWLISAEIGFLGLCYYLVYAAGLL